MRVQVCDPVLTHLLFNWPFWGRYVRYRVDSLVMAPMTCRNMPKTVLTY